MKPDEVQMNMGDDAQPPDDRLARIADTGRKAMAADPEWDDDIKLIISVSGVREGGKEGGGMFVSGYEVDEEDKARLENVPEELQQTMAEQLVSAHVVAVLMEHVEALLTQVTGLPVRVIPVSPVGPVNLTTPN